MSDWQGIYILVAYGLAMALLGSYIGAFLEHRRIRRKLRKFFGVPDEEAKGK